jgi:hypothetical protein
MITLLNRYKWHLILVGAVLLTWFLMSAAADRKAAAIVQASDARIRNYQQGQALEAAKTARAEERANALARERDAKVAEITALKGQLAAMPAPRPLPQVPVQVIDREQWSPRVDLIACYDRLEITSRIAQETQTALDLCGGEATSLRAAMTSLEAQVTAAWVEIDQLIIARDKLAKLAKRPWGVVAGLTAGMTSKGEWFIGAGITAGKRML